MINWLSIKKSLIICFSKINKRRDYVQIKWRSCLYIDYIVFKNGHVIFVQNFLGVVVKQSVYSVIADEDCQSLSITMFFSKKVEYRKQFEDPRSFSIALLQLWGQKNHPVKNPYIIFLVSFKIVFAENIY